MSTGYQRQKIGYLRKLLGLDDDTYYEMLSGYGVKSSKDLSFQQAREFLNRLRDNGKQAGVFKPKIQYAFQQYKHNNLDNRDPLMATPAQLRKIEAMWFRVSTQTTDTARYAALEKFCYRVVGKEKLQFLTKEDIAKLVTALNAMRRK